MLSRDEPLSTEWSLSTQDFQKIQQLEPRLEVDLFATSFNNKLLTFISPCPDSLAAGVDALAIPWEKWSFLYLFPPTPLISKVLAKITNTQFAKAILITPDTPTRHWFMSLQLRRIPSVPLKAQLFQVVVDTVETLPYISNLRVWMLSARHMKNNSQTIQEF